MDILFSTEALRRLCHDEREQQRKLGSPGAKKLRGRLSDLQAAARVTDLVAGRPHALLRDREGQYAVDLHGACRLVFAPSAVPPPMRPEGGIAWEMVTSVTIVFIGDYHD